MPTATSSRQTAINHVENQLYDGADADVVGMTSTQHGTRVGLEVTVSSGAGISGFPLGLIIGIPAGLVAMFVAPDPLFIAMVGSIGFIVGLVFGGSGTAKRYATVTIDDTGAVVMANKDYNEPDFADVMDRPVSAAAARANATASARHQAKQDAILQRKVREQLVDSFFGFYDKDKDDDDEDNN